MMLKITQKKGLVGATQSQKATIASLGLHKIHQSVTHQDNAAIRGQIRKVTHLVDVEEVE
ncbi:MULTISPECIES: 50S ribosomal protein L30 [Trueperella]|uniref:Large ribosomal subunit protein uL30 n=1 Tax=Trueperella bernardiae TaxID=59561 RepID=A0AAW6ZLD1_9ACTO|nr:MULTISPECIES: 50S ribosomal protein L30 [Trueperella]MCM3907073.1 50S ribosomal protein L30 [Trueperella bernardiae]MDK8601548.1 50S ribosomal protein L30 [Trueperella bernardiae]MDV6238927.1 50S ribosomal protein L30 [Trueperella bernardiae]OCW60508.1 50S ribosomal protein L30 [Trueperella bernardiae]OFS67220.1 50S ribosomal protein L30 [Trueperella sp. HMSC08H06]